MYFKGMKMYISLLPLLATCWSIVSAITHDDFQTSSLPPREAIPNTYLLEYVDSPDSHAHHLRLMSLLAPITQAIKVRQVYHNQHVFSGMSVQFDSDQPIRTFSKLLNIQPLLHSSLKRDRIQRRPTSIENNAWVKTIYPLYQVPQPDWTAEPMLASYAAAPTLPQRPFDDRISQTQSVHDKIGATGKDVLVCLLDSGVDYRHPALGGGIGARFKIKMGANLVDPKEDDNALGHHLGKDDPMDPCPANGHGTHVAGIVAGLDPEMRFRGVAPNATLGMWRIFGCDIGASEDIVIQGLNLAHQAGCDIINLSLGVQNAWPEDAMAVVAERLSQQGVIVVTVAGNQGEAGAFLQNTPGTGKHVVSVASVDNSIFPTKVMNVDSIPDEPFLYEFSSTTNSFPDGTLMTLYNSSGMPTDGCSGADLKELRDSDKVRGNILLVQRGTCTFDEKANYAHNYLGAVAILVYDEQEDTVDKEGVNTFAIKTKNNTIPVASIPRSLGQRLTRSQKEDVEDEIKTSSSSSFLPTHISFPPELFDEMLDSALQVSPFSSAGPNYELDLKPNVAGIGGQIFSTLPLHLKNYGSLGKGWGLRSGTSMAAPHVTGVLALLLEAFRENKQIKDHSLYLVEHLQNHAMVPMKKEEDNKVPNHPLLQGAGLAQPYDAIMNPLHISPSQISFNDTASMTDYKTHTLQVTNHGTKEMTLKVEHFSAKSIRPYSDVPHKDENQYTYSEPIGRGEAHVSLKISPRQLTVAPGETKPVEVQVQLPTLPHDYQMYGGYLQWILDSENEKSIVQASVPYFGILGALHDLPIFDDGFPYLARADNITDVYTVADTFPFSLDHANEPLRKSDDDGKDDEIKVAGQQKAQSNVAMAGNPAVVCRLLTATREIQGEIIDSNDNVVGYIPDFPVIYWERNRRKPEEYHRQFAWDGQIQAVAGIGAQKQTIRPGTFHIRMRALKLLGNYDDPKEWETWVSGPILVKSSSP